jgi:hypothetical protein
MDEKEYQLERKKLRHLKWATFLTALVALVAAGVSFFAVYASSRWQSELLLLQVAQNPQDFFCSQGVETLLSEEIDATPKEFEDICQKTQAFPPTLDVRRDFVALLVANPDKQFQIVAAYHVLYGKNADWIDKIAEAVPAG